MENDFGLVELVQLLQSIDENAEGVEENPYIIRDKDGNKSIL